MNIEIPDIPKSLNPNGWEVEASGIGECKEGDWALYLYRGGWVKATCQEDDAGSICARLVEPRYMFEGVLKTESECREILERDYEIFDGGGCGECPFYHPSPSSPCPYHDGGPFSCKSGAWRKKQPKPETLSTPTPEMEECINEMMRPEQPANLPEGHVAAVAMEIIEYLIRQGTRKFK